MADKKAATKNRSPEAVARSKRVAREEARRGLWVVTQSSMKQYGDVAIERVGQVIKQQYLRNDDKLLKHGYVRVVNESEDYETCEHCGLVFLGNSITGPFAQHLHFARHDKAVLDLDGPNVKTPKTPGRVGNEDSPDSDNKSVWDLEPDGAPAPTKVEGSGERVSM